jgi:hypothetical protein
VSRDFTKREWVVRRCEHALNKVLKHLQALNPGPAVPGGQASDGPVWFHDLVLAWLFGTGVTTHILLAAGLKNPTVRKRYLAARELLAEYGHADLYETLLEMLGCARMSQAQAEQHLVRLAAVFDAAQAFQAHAPFPFSADLSPLARPVAIEGSRELIERGDQREAVFWMAVTYTRCLKVLAQVGPPGMAEIFSPGFRALLADLEIRSTADLKQRSRQVLELLPQVWAAAEAIIAANPEITA